MLVSTRGRYALRVMVEIARAPNDTYVSLKSIAKGQEISEKYIESIISSLVKEKLLVAYRGKSGGYKLVKPMNEYTVYDILKLTEGTLAPVACLANENNECSRNDKCLTLPVWQGLNKAVCDYLTNITLSDIVSQNFESIPIKEDKPNE